MASPGKKLTGWWLEKVRKHASGKLESGETLRGATYGQETKHMLTSLLCFWKPRLIAVSDRHIYVFEGGAVNSSHVGELRHKASRATAQIERHGRAIVIDDIKIYPPPGAKAETDQLMSTLAGPDEAQATVPATVAPTPANSPPPPASAAPATPATTDERRAASIPPPAG